MKPFNATYYVKNNKNRSIALIIMLASIVIIYIGGLYITSFDHIIDYNYKVYDEYTFISMNYGCSEEEYNKIVKEFRNSNSVGQVLPANKTMMLNGTNELSIPTTFGIITFGNEEDAKSFYRSIYPESDMILKDGELVLSAKVAKNCRLKVGDTINQDSVEGYKIDKEYRISQIIESNQFFAYGIDEGAADTFLAVRPEAKGREKQLAIMQFKAFIGNYRDNNNVVIMTYEYVKERIQQQTKAIDFLFYGISILIIFILSVTVNATFLGAYDKRQFEFSLYKAIGFSKQEISCKIFKEVMLINCMGIVVAAIVALSVTWLANVLYYYPSGLELKYFNLKSLICMAICDVLVIVPVVMLRISKIKKYDITEY